MAKLPLDYATPPQHTPRRNWRLALRFTLQLFLSVWISVWVLAIPVHLVDPRGGADGGGAILTMSARIFSVAGDVTMISVGIVGLVFARRLVGKRESGGST